MPELAEVEFMRRKWEPALGGSVEAVEADYRKQVFRGLDAGIIEKKLNGMIFVEALRHGKQLCFRFSDDVWLGVHLGMTGVLKFSPISHENSEAGSAEPKGRKYSKVDEGEGANEAGRYCCLKIKTTKGVLTFHDSRLFGRIQIHRGQFPPDWWQPDIPEPHVEAFTTERLRTILQRHGRTPIKALLLDQSYFPGIGNWMADEVLWRARIHPAEKAGKLADTEVLAELKQRLKEVCEDALRVIAPDWGTPPDEWLFNHRWEEGGVCPVSGGKLVREKIGGRTACYSPALQRLL